MNNSRTSASSSVSAGIQRALRNTIGDAISRSASTHGSRTALVV